MTQLERARAVVETWNEELRRELPEKRTCSTSTRISETTSTGWSGATTSSRRFSAGTASAAHSCSASTSTTASRRSPSQQPDARPRRTIGREAPPVRPARSHDPAPRGSTALPRPRRERHKAASAGPGIRAQRRAASAGLRARRGAICAILIHGGRGLPPIAKDLERPGQANVGVRLIVAHAGIADMGGLAGRLGGSMASSSTPPSGAASTSSTSTARSRRSRCSTPRTTRTPGSRTRYSCRPDREARQIRRQAAPPDARRQRTPDDRRRGTRATLGAHGPTSLVQPLTFARIHQYISMAVPMLWLRQRDVIGALGLAVNASRERSNGHPERPSASRSSSRRLRSCGAPARRSRTTTSASRPSVLPSSSSTSRTWSR